MPSSKIVPAAGEVPPPVAAFKAIRSARAFEEIATQIRSELIARRLKVGSRLPSERALSEQFGVSRNTLREALRSLEHAGLIRLQKGASGGAFISERSGRCHRHRAARPVPPGFDPAGAVDAGAHLAGNHHRARGLHARHARGHHRASSQHRRSGQAHADGNFPLRATKHLEFHRILARISGNPIMVIVMNGVLDVLHHFVTTIGDYRTPSCCRRADAS